MAHRKVKKSKHPQAKGPIVGVRLTQQDMDDVTECARLESERRGEIVHESALLRELSMPRVRELLTILKAPAAVPA